jgi:COP9 signalosome complex subunit 2
MSDFDDDDMLYDSDAGSMGEMADEDDPAVRAENRYFEAKDLAAENAEEGLEAFEDVLTIETEPGNWGFKSLKRIIKIQFSLGKHDEVKTNFAKWLKDYSSLLMENEKALNSLLEYLNSSPNIQDFYNQTMERLEKNGNKKAVLRLELRLAKVLFERKDFAVLEKKLEAMHKDCLGPDGKDDLSKGNQLMDIYALEISMESQRENYPKLRSLYERAMKIPGLANPRVSGVIHECGGKMHMRERHWQDAFTDFFEAFKNFDDAGLRQNSSQCLKYLVLANMLSDSDINPFHEQRARSYQDNTEIKAMIALVEHYQKRDIRRFESVLAANKQALLGDLFLASFMDDLMKKLRSAVLQARIKPYTNMSLDFISMELGIKTEDVTSLLVELILDGVVAGKVDQINQVLELKSTKSSTKFQALDKLATGITTMTGSLFARLN